jgi:hypothetical protein
MLLKESNAMTDVTTTSPIALMPGLEVAWQEVDSSFERFCLTGGSEAMEQMLAGDAQRLVGRPHSRGRGRVPLSPRHHIGSRFGATGWSDRIALRDARH